MAGTRTCPRSAEVSLSLSASPPCMITPDLRLGPTTAPSVPISGGMLVPRATSSPLQEPPHPSSISVRLPPPCHPLLPCREPKAGLSGRSPFPLDLCSPPHLSLVFLEIKPPLLGSPASCYTYSITFKSHVSSNTVNLLCLAGGEMDS